MMASVFFMQPLGQISGNIVTIIVIASSQGNDNIRRTVDIMWRWVIGIGVVPGVLALAFRLAIPETPRFLLDIEDDPIKAEFDATPLFGIGTELEDGVWPSADASTTSHEGTFEEIILPAPAVSEEGHYTVSGVPPLITLNSSWKLSKADIIQYFWIEGNWRTLFATAMTWALLDFGFYGIGLSSPQFLAKTWGSLTLDGPAPPWKTNDTGNVSQYKQFMDNSIHALVILNSGSFLGMVLMIIFSNRVNRVSLQKYGFLVLAVVFIVLGSIFISTHRSGGATIIALYVLCQTAFNFGPNATTYIISGEVFPTRYRASCHGISAAAGKLGSILVQVFSVYYRFGSNSTTKEGTKRYGTIIIIFAAVMLIGAVLTHFWIPDVQHKRSKGSGWTAAGKNKSLEELALGRRGTESQSVVRARRAQN
jgi:MFS transporter, PHS family, inorganic phosphate transporter